MDKRTKLLLSIVGVCAIVIPALLLIFLTPKTQKEPEVSSESRTINPDTIKNLVQSVPPKQPVFPSPSPASASARPAQPAGSSPSAD